MQGICICKRKKKIKEAQICIDVLIELWGARGRAAKYAVNRLKRILLSTSEKEFSNRDIDIRLPVIL